MLKKSKLGILAALMALVLSLSFMFGGCSGSKDDGEDDTKKPKTEENSGKNDGEENNKDSGKNNNPDKGNKPNPDASSVTPKMLVDEIAKAIENNDDSILAKYIYFDTLDIYNDETFLEKLDILDALDGETDVTTEFDGSIYVLSEIKKDGLNDDAVFDDADEAIEELEELMEELQGMINDNVPQKTALQDMAYASCTVYDSDDDWVWEYDIILGKINGQWWIIEID